MAHQLPDEELELLLEDIHETGRELARAAALAKVMEKLVGISEANLMKILEVGGVSSIAAQKRDARSHPTYRGMVDKWQAAVEDEVNRRVANENAVRRWESWRTLSANSRHIR